MKKIIAITFIFFSANALKAQPNVTIGKVQYEIQIKNKTTLVEMNFSPTSYIYRYINPLAIPTQRKNYTSIDDSLKDEMNRKRINESLAKIPVQQWYGTIANNVITYSTFDNKQKMYCIRDTIHSLHWELTPDTATINGLFCQKAISKIPFGEYVAWYAPSIPVSAAPFSFRGLPGLLIKVYNSVSNSTTSMTYLEWPSKTIIPIEPCSVGPYISKTEFRTIKDKQQTEAKNMLESLKNIENRRSGKQ